MTDVYREESELLDEECLLRLAGLRDLPRGDLAGDPRGRLAGDLDLLPDLLLLLGDGERLPLGGDLLRGDGDLLLPPPNPLLGGDLPRGGDQPLPPLPPLTGDLLLGLGRLLVTLGTRTGAAEISWPSICPPSMCFIAFCASACVSYSIYAKPLLSQGLILSLPNSISLIFPNVEKISLRWSLFTFLVSLPICILVGWGVADLFRRGFGDPEPLLGLAAGLPLSLMEPDLVLLLGGGEGDNLLRGTSTPSGTMLDSGTSLLTPGDVPGSL